MRRHRCGQRREVLPLAVAAQDHHQLGRCAVGTQAVERGHGRADVGALAVIESVDAGHRGHVLDAVGLSGVLPQPMQHGCERAVDGRGERQRRERVRGVVATANAQRVGRHEVLQSQSVGVVSERRRRWRDVVCKSIRMRFGARRHAATLRSGRGVQGLCAHQPGHAVVDDETVIARAPRRVEAEAHRHRRLDAHRLAPTAQGRFDLCGR